MRLTVHVLADAGNILDCSCLAGIVAFKHFRKPEVEVIGDEVIVVRIETDLLLISLTFSPIALTIRTRTHLACNTSHTVLCDVRVLPGCIDATRGGPIFA